MNGCLLNEPFMFLLVAPEIQIFIFKTLKHFELTFYMMRVPRMKLFFSVYRIITHYEHDTSHEKKIDH